MHPFNNDKFIITLSLLAEIIAIIYQRDSCFIQAIKRLIRLIWLRSLISCSVIILLPYNSRSSNMYNY